MSRFCGKTTSIFEAYQNHMVSNSTYLQTFDTVYMLFSTFDTSNLLQHTYHLMIWLESPKSQHSKTLFWIVNWLNIKKVMSKKVMSP